MDLLWGYISMPETRRLRRQGCDSSREAAGPQAAAPLEALPNRLLQRASCAALRWRGGAVGDVRRCISPGTSSEP